MGHASIERLVNSVIEKIEENIEDTEIQSRLIGEMVMEELVVFDPVSYIKFASINRDFTSLVDYLKCIQILTKDPKKSEADSFFPRLSDTET